MALNRKEKAAATLVEMCSVRLEQRCSACRSRTFWRLWARRGRSRFRWRRAYVGGLVHYRGDVLTTVSLRQLLDMPPQEGTQDLLVLESAGGCFGLLVDSVGEVLTVSSADHEPNPSMLDERRRALICGRIQAEGQPAGDAGPGAAGPDAAGCER